MSFNIRANPPRKFVTTPVYERKSFINKHDFHKIKAKQSYNDALIGNNTLFYQNTMGNYLNDNMMNYATNAPAVSMNSRNTWDAIQYNNLPLYNELRGLKNGYNVMVPKTTKFNRLNINFNNDNPPYKVQIGTKPTRESRDFNDKEAVGDSEHVYDATKGHVLPTEEAQVTDKAREKSMLIGEEKEDPLIKDAVKRVVFDHADHTAVYVNSLQHRPDLSAPMKGPE